LSRVAPFAGPVAMIPWSSQAFGPFVKIINYGCGLVSRRQMLQYYLWSVEIATDHRRAHQDSDTLETHTEYKRRRMEFENTNWS
jgi:hypothetical protein